MFKKLTSFFKGNCLASELVIMHDIQTVFTHITAHFPDIDRDNLSVAVETDSKNKNTMFVRINDDQETVDRIKTMLDNSQVTAVKRRLPSMIVEKMSPEHKAGMEKMQEMLRTRPWMPHPYG